MKHAIIVCTFLFLVACSDGPKSFSSAELEESLYNLIEITVEQKNSLSMQDKANFLTLCSEYPFPNNNFPRSDLESEFNQNVKQFSELGIHLPIIMEKAINKKALDDKQLVIALRLSRILVKELDKPL